MKISDEIATVIAETLGLTVSNSANEIRLEGPGCEQVDSFFNICIFSYAIL